jgi:hypothetical protein
VESRSCDEKHEYALLFTPSLRCGTDKGTAAFFTLGPLLVTKDVPKVYDSIAVLQADSWLKTQNQDDPTKKQAAYSINLPIAGGKGFVIHLLSLLFL